MTRSYFLLTLLFWQPLTAQNTTKDSLLTILSKAKEDSNKVLLLISIGQEALYNNPDEAKIYYSQAKVLSEKLRYQMGLIKYYGRYSEALNWQGRYDSSLMMNLQALSVAEAYGNKERIAMAMHNIAGSYSFLEDYEKALEWQLKALPIIESGGDSSKMSIIYDAMGITYRNVKLVDKSIEYHQKALAICEKINDPIGAAIALSNLGGAYTTQQKYTLALEAFKKSVAISKDLNAPSIQKSASNNIADLYFKQGIYDSIRPYSEEGLRLAKETDDSSAMSLSLYTLAIHYFFKKDFAKSESFAQEGYGISQRNNYLNTHHLHSNIRSELALVRGDLKMYGYFDHLSDSLNEAFSNETIRKNVQLLDKRYETEKKEQQLRLQESQIKQKNTLNYVFGFSALALLIISVLAYRNYSHKRKLQEQKISELEKEKLLLATQSILKGQEEERSRLAKDLHDGLGGMLSGVKLQLGSMKGNLIMSEELNRSFNSALNKLDETINEMRRVAHNMMPEALLRLGLPQALQDYCHSLAESQQFTINCEFHSLEERMPSTTEIVVYRIVQELVNNAVKHSGATTILAQVIRQSNNLSITVEDNGKGFPNIEEALTKGSGLLSIKSRVDYLKGQMDIQSAPGKGSSIHIDCLIEPDAKN